MAQPSLPEPAGWGSFLTEQAARALAEANRCFDSLKQRDSGAAMTAMRLWNDAAIALDSALALAELAGQMHPDDATRRVADQQVEALGRFTTNRDQDPDLYAVLERLDVTALDPDAARVHRLTLRDFRRNGVDKPPATRQRLAELAERATVLEHDFQRNINDDDRRYRIAPVQLSGVPEDFLAAHPPDPDDLVNLSGDWADVTPILTFATDPEARRQARAAEMNRGQDANRAVLSELLAVRAERAQLLGYADWSTYQAEVNMVENGAAVAEFIDHVATLAEPAARRDYQLLLDRQRADEPTATTVRSTDKFFYLEQLRRERYAVDGREVRRYFRFDRVMAGLLDVTGRLFGIEYVPRSDVTRWHPDVTVYDVRAVGGDLIGRIHLDMHPRPGKFNYAAMFPVVPGIAGRQLPEGALLCNFGTGLLDHYDAVVIFHEFGHVLHHLLGGAQEWARFSGVNTELDFIETPSQLLEEWAWDAEVLASFAVDDDGRPIPTQLVEQMQAANRFGVAADTRNQAAFAAISYQLHTVPPADCHALAIDLLRHYDMFEPDPDLGIETAFIHLAAYGSNYYAYLWSLVIAKDLFAGFDADDLFEPTVTARYRDAVLVPGGRRPAAELVADFLGRRYSTEPFAAWLAGSAD